MAGEPSSIPHTLRTAGMPRESCITSTRSTTDESRNLTNRTRFPNGAMSHPRRTLRAARCALCLQIVNTTVCALSLAGSTFVIACYCAFPRMRKFTFRLVLYLACADLVRRVAYRTQRRAELTVAHGVAWSAEYDLARGEPRSTAPAARYVLCDARSTATGSDAAAGVRRDDRYLVVLGSTLGVRKG
jgi:hypothetical protein